MHAAENYEFHFLIVLQKFVQMILTFEYIVLNIVEKETNGLTLLSKKSLFNRKNIFFCELYVSKNTFRLRENNYGGDVH